MEERIKESLKALMDAIKRADGSGIAGHMAQLDALVAEGRAALHPQLVHFLERRSYPKALLFLGGESDIPRGILRREGLNVPDKVSTDGGGGLAHNPFAALSLTGLKPAPAAAKAPAPKPEAPARNRGRVDITREKGGRGGKTVTVIDGFTGIGLPEKEQLVRKMRGACGCGGTVKDGRIEIQGDQRDTVARILTDAGFRPVFAGG